MQIGNWLFFGIVIGLIASLVDPRQSGGIIGPILVGFLGSLFGIFMGQMILSFINLDNSSLLLGTLAGSGALVFLFISRLFKGFNNQSHLRR